MKVVFYCLTFSIIVFTSNLHILISQDIYLIDSLNTIISNSKEDTSKVKHLLRIAREYRSYGRWKSVLRPAEDAYKIASTLNNIHGIADAAYILGDVYGYFAEYDKALTYYHISASNYSVIKKRDKEIYCWSSISYIHQERKDYNSQLKSANIALEISQKMNDSSYVLSTMNVVCAANISLCKYYVRHKDSKRANEFYTKSIENSLRMLKNEIERRDSLAIANRLVNVANTYDPTTYVDSKDSLLNINILEIYDTSKIVSFFLQAIDIYSKIKNVSGVNWANYCLSIYYKHQGLFNALMRNEELSKILYSNALNYSILALNGIKKEGYPHGIANYSKNMGEIYSLLKDHKSADNLLLSALNIFKDINYTHGIKEINYLLYQNAFDAKDFELSLQYFTDYSTVKENIFNEEKMKFIDELNVKYESEKKDNDNILLRFQNELMDRNNQLLSSENRLFQMNYSNEKNLRLFSDNLSRQRSDSILHLEEQRKANELLTRQAEELRIIELELQDKKMHAKNILVFVLTSMIFLSALIVYLILQARTHKLYNKIKDTEEKALRAQLKPHFVFNALSSIQNYVRTNPQVAEEYLVKFSHFTQEVLVNSEKKQIPLADELSMLEKYIALHNLRLKSPIQYSFNIDPRIDPEEIMIPPAILQPLVENCINHSFSIRDGQGHLGIQISEEDGILRCQLNDSCEGDLKELTIKSSRMPDRKSFGTEIVKERIELWAKGKSKKPSLEFIPHANGMNVILGLPL